MPADEKTRYKARNVSEKGLKFWSYFGYGLYAWWLLVVAKDGKLWLLAK